MATHHRSASERFGRLAAALLVLLSCGGDEVEVEALGPLIFVESADSNGQRVASLTTEGQRGADLGVNHMLIVSPRWSPSGAMIAYIGFETDRLRDLWIVDVDAGRPREPRSVLRWDTAEAPPLLHWLPDESGLLWSEATDVAPALRRLDLTTGEDTWYPQVQLYDIDVAADGRIVGNRSDEQGDTLAVYDAAYVLVAQTEPDVGESPRWSPDATQVAFVVRAEPGIAILDPSTGAWERLTEADDRHVRWSPDGSQLSFVRGGQLFVRERASGEERLVIDADAGSHEWSRAGGHVVMPRPDRTIALLTTSDWTLLEIEDALASIPNLDWGPG